MNWPHVIATALRTLLVMVWIIMGLGCKVLGRAPRHEEIVARILGGEFAPLLVKLIGVGEIGIAVWILSGIHPRTCACFQIVLVVTMNLIELTLARDLLLFGWRKGHVALFKETPFEGVTPILANAFAVEDIPYRWERGRYLNPPSHD